MAKTNNKSKVQPDLRLWELFDRTSFSAARLRELELAQFGLTLEQSAILVILRRNNGMTIAKELEHITMRQHHSITTLINRMIKAGLVTKEKSTEGRSYKILITDYGQKASESMTTTSFEMAFSILTAKEKQNLTAYLTTLLDKSRNLLGISSSPTFLEYLITGNTARKKVKKTKEEELSPDFELWKLLDRTRFAVGRLRELELAQYGLTIEQAAILAIIIGNKGSASTKEIEFDTMRQNHSITTLINRMIKADLVGKEKTSKGRRFRIVATENGADLLKKSSLASIEMAFGSLTDKEKENLEDYLTRILEKTRNLLGISSKPAFM